MGRFEGEGMLDGSCCRVGRFEALQKRLGGPLISRINIGLKACGYQETFFFLGIPEHDLTVAILAQAFSIFEGLPS